MAQADGWQLGHNDADECDGSQAWFVVGQLDEQGRQRNKGGNHRLQFTRLYVGLYNKKNNVVSTYSLGYRSISKGKVTGESCICYSVALGMLGKAVRSCISSTAYSGILQCCQTIGHAPLYRSYTVILYSSCLLKRPIYKYHTMIRS